MERIRSDATRYGHGYAAILLDLDHFKVYNDLFGHLAGDDALRMIAEESRRVTRESDLVFRWGGEEYLVVLPEQDLAGAVQTAERIRAGVHGLAIENPANDSGRMTVSAGVAVLDPILDATNQEWLNRADMALYRAKAAGRNRTMPEVAPAVDVSQIGTATA